MPQAFAAEINNTTTNIPLNPKQQALLKLLLPSLGGIDHKRLSPPEINSLDNNINNNFEFISPASPQVVSIPSAVMAVGDLNPAANKTVRTDILLKSFALMGDAGHTQLLIQLAAPVFYEISEDVLHKTLTLRLDNINPLSIIIPVDTDNTAVQNIRFEYNDQHQLMVILTLAHIADIQGLRMTGENPAELVLDAGIGSIPYLHPQVQTVKTPGRYQPLVKKLAAPTVDEVVQTRYAEAMDLLARHNINGAKILLESLLAKIPNIEQARVSLAEIYLDQNHPQKALLLLAPMHFSDPSVAAHADYYTLLAEAYRQSGRPLQAMKVYRSLLAFDPDNAVWWAGLGLCFQALHQTSAEHAAFLKAIDLGNLPLPLKIFIEKQLHLTLQGGRTAS